MVGRAEFAVLSPLQAQHVRFDVSQSPLDAGESYLQRVMFQGTGRRRRGGAGFARGETASSGQTRSVDETGTTVIFASPSCSCLRDMTNTGRALSPWPDLAAMG